MRDYRCRKKLIQCYVIGKMHSKHAAISFIRVEWMSGMNMMDRIWSQKHTKFQQNIWKMFLSWLQECIRLPRPHEQTLDKHFGMPTIASADVRQQKRYEISKALFKNYCKVLDIAEWYCSSLMYAFYAYERWHITAKQTKLQQCTSKIDFKVTDVNSKIANLPVAVTNTAKISKKHQRNNFQGWFPWAIINPCLPFQWIKEPLSESMSQLLMNATSGGDVLVSLQRGGNKHKIKRNAFSIVSLNDERIWKHWPTSQPIHTCKC